MTRPLRWVGSQKDFDKPPETAFWVAAPVRLHRVIVETPPYYSEGDPFTRAVVNLASAGVCDVREIGRLMGIEDLQFIEEVVRRLVELNILKVRRDTVELGRSAEKYVGAVDGDSYVWYLIQDGHTGRLWPRALIRTLTPEFDAERRTVRMGTAGAPAKRNYWFVPWSETERPFDHEKVKSSIQQHLHHIRTLRLKPSSPEASHLAFLGRPEQRATYSVRLVDGLTDAQILVPFLAPGDVIEARDPCGVGPWSELREWTAALMTAEPRLAEKIIAWSQRRTRRANSDINENAEQAPSIAFIEPGAKALLLADNFRQYLARCTGRSLGLAHERDTDQRLLRSRLRSLGFIEPRQELRVIPAIVQRAAAGDPVDLLDLFVAWVLVVTQEDALILVQSHPDLPDQLIRLANERQVGKEVTELEPTRSANTADKGN